VAWDKTKPANDELLINFPAQARANWEAIELGTDANLLITNAKCHASMGLVDTKLAQITTAGKVSGAALTLLANIPGGAGLIPVANIPNLSATKITSGTLAVARCDTGTTANKLLQLNGDAKIPAVDGSLLTNIKSSDLAIASQARGDIIYFDGTNWVRLPKGTDGQYLKIGANDPAWAAVSGGDMSYANTRFSIGKGSKAAAYGANAHSGFGFQPKIVQIIATVGTTGGRISIGWSNGTNHYCVYNQFASYSTSYVAKIDAGSGNYLYATLAMNADGFTITWAKNGSFTDTVYYHWLAYR